MNLTGGAEAAMTIAPVTAFMKDLPSLGGATAVTNMVTLTEAEAAAMGVSVLASFVAQRGIRPSNALRRHKNVVRLSRGDFCKADFLYNRSSSSMLVKHLPYGMVVALGNVFCN